MHQRIRHHYDGMYWQPIVTSGRTVSELVREARLWFDVVGGGRR
ncbi:hypothetical protein [Halorussus halophilus]|nr:hypothetical protein [Halorussus halophilus]